MARFTIDASRLNFSVERRGKEYNVRLLQRAQAIFSTLLRLLPSNYTSTVQGPQYTIELKAVAVELAKIELSLEDVNMDVDFSRTRSEFLYSVVGYLCFLNNRLPSLEFDDEEFRQFLLNLIRIYFKGSVPAAIRDAVALFLKTDFKILENFLLIREGSAGLDISDQFGFQIDIGTGNEFPPGVFDLQSSIRVILDIVRPAHTLFQIRFVFTDTYVPSDPSHSVKDEMWWALKGYHYDDFRSYWGGERDLNRLGRKENRAVVGESHGSI